MKFKLFAMLLALSLVAWGQENQSAAIPNSTPKPEAKSCCHHTANAKDETACLHHANAGAKDGASCCGKDAEQCNEKDAKACCSGTDMKAQMKKCKKKANCKDANCGGTADGKSAMNCCGTKCGHEHAASAS